MPAARAYGSQLRFHPLRIRRAARIACSEPPRLVQYPRCLGTDGKIVAGADTEMIVWSAEPQPDGTLRGVWSNTVLTAECGGQGMVFQAPLVATRTGDVPPTITVADPATVATVADTPTINSPIPAVAGVTPVLDGTFRVDYDWANQTVNGEATTGPGTTDSDWWAFRSLCTSAGCVVLICDHPGEAVGLLAWPGGRRRWPRSVRASSRNATP
jgi:hypothetical protein